VTTADEASRVTPQVLPADLAELPPGPRLSAALASLDLRRLTAHQLAVVIAAQNRQIAYEQSRLLAAVWELGHTPLDVRDAVVREPDPVPFAMVEAAQAGRWTQQHANETRDLACFVLDQVPALGDALAAGQVDLAKVKVFQRLLSNVADVALMRTIVALALPSAVHGTTGTLRSRLYRLRCKLSPEAVRRQRERDHDSRYLAAHQEISGLVTLVARFCDEQAALAALEHIDAIAAATRAAGDPLGRSTDQLRADIALSLLAGVDPAQAGFATPADRKGVITVTVNLATLAGLTGLPGLSMRSRACPHATLTEQTVLSRLTAADPGLAGLCPQCLAQAADLVLEPGDLAGYGPLAAHIARQTVAHLARVSTWRFAVTDDYGRQVAEGVIPADRLPDMDVEMRRWAADASAGPDGRAHRTPTAAQAAFVRARDRHCQAPGCRVPAHRCQIDHRIPWHSGGPTLIDNLYCLCRLHHRAKDEAGFTYHPTGRGLRWTTPAGHIYLTRPPSRLTRSRLTRSRRRRDHRALGIVVTAAAYRHRSRGRDGLA
jgi:HNH endonuclease.